MRITQANLLLFNTQNLQQQQQRLVTLQEQAASGSALLDPTADPSAYSQSLTLQHAQSAATSLDKTSQQVQEMMGTYDNVLGQVEQNLASAKSLALEATSPSMDSQTRQALQNQVNDLLNQTVSLANYSDSGRYIFGGSKNGQPPYTSVSGTNGVTSVTFTGDQRTQSAVFDNGVTVASTVSGTDVFGNPPDNASSAIGALISLRDGLANGDQTSISNSANALDNASNQVLAVRAEVGVRTQHLQSLDTFRQQVEAQLTKSQASVSDTNLPATATQLASQQLAYEAAINVTYQMNQQMSLLTQMSKG